MLTFSKDRRCSVSRHPVYFLSLGIAYEQKTTNSGKLPGNLTQSLGAALKMQRGIWLSEESRVEPHPPSLFRVSKWEGARGSVKAGHLGMRSSSPASDSRGLPRTEKLASGVHCQITLLPCWQVLLKAQGTERKRIQVRSRKFPKSCAFLHRPVLNYVRPNTSPPALTGPLTLCSALPFLFSPLCTFSEPCSPMKQLLPGCGVCVNMHWSSYFHSVSKLPQLPPGSLCQALSTSKFILLGPLSLILGGTGMLITPAFVFQKNTSCTHAFALSIVAPGVFSPTQTLRRGWCV